MQTAPAPTPRPATPDEYLKDAVSVSTAGTAHVPIWRARISARLSRFNHPVVVEVTKAIVLGVCDLKCRQVRAESEPVRIDRLRHAPSFHQE